MFVSKDVELSFRLLFIAINHLYHIYAYIHVHVYTTSEVSNKNTSNFCLSKNGVVFLSFFLLGTQFLQLNSVADILVDSIVLLAFKTMSSRTHAHRITKTYMTAIEIELKIKKMRKA